MIFKRTLPLRTSRIQETPPTRSRKGRDGLRVSDAPSWRLVKNMMIKPAFARLRALGIYCRVTHLPYDDDELHFTYEQFSEDFVGFNDNFVPVDEDETYDYVYLQHSLCSCLAKRAFDVFSSVGFVVIWPELSHKIAIQLILPTDPREHWSILRQHVVARSVFWFWHSLTAHLHEPSASRGRDAILAFSAAFDEDDGTEPT